LSVGRPVAQASFSCPSGNSPSPLAAVGSHLPQRSALPSGGLLFLLVRVGTKPCRRALLAARQVPAQPFQSLDPATGGAPSWPKKSRQKNDTKGRRLEFAPANTCTVRVAAKHLRCTLFAQTQAAAQPLRSLDSATGGAPLRPPLIPLPHYSLFLRIWVALPTQGDSAGATVAKHLAQQRGRTGFLS